MTTVSPHGCIMPYDELESKSWLIQDGDLANVLVTQFQHLDVRVYHMVHSDGTPSYSMSVGEMPHTCWHSISCAQFHEAILAIVDGNRERLITIHLRYLKGEV